MWIIERFAAPTAAPEPFAGRLCCAFAMRKILLLLPLLLAPACRAQESMSNNGAGTPKSTEPAAATFQPGNTAPAAGQPVQTTTLTGLYEGGAAGRRNQLCAIERPGSETRFGLVVWGEGTEGCSGTGTATRQGPTMRLSLSGDEACTIEARTEGARLSFPAALPAGCAYYCSRGASFDGASFDKVGGAEADAQRAQDLAGDRLCAER